LNPVRWVICKLPNPTVRHLW